MVLVCPVPTHLVINVNHAASQAKSTGQLSLATSVMGLAGCTARIFTSVQEGAGLSMVRGFVLGKPVLAIGLV